HGIGQLYRSGPASCFRRKRRGRSARRALRRSPGPETHGLACGKTMKARGCARASWKLGEKVVELDQAARIAFNRLGRPGRKLVEHDHTHGDSRARPHKHLLQPDIDK